MCIEELKTQIFQLRNACGSKRQSSYATKLQEFCNILIDCGNAHPFALTYEQEIEFVEKTKIFSEGAKGVVAKVKEAEHIYRIQPIRGFLRTVKWSDPSVTPNDPDEVWDKLINNSKKSSDGWLKLKRYAGGTYPAQPNDENNLKYWNFAWWTTYDLPINVMLGATKIGMFSNWVVPKTVVLRTPAPHITDKQVAHVPTIIDAFMQPIFHPVLDAPPPEAGITIDLSNDALGEGVDEYIIKPVNTEFIEILPYPVSAAMVKQFGEGREENSRLLKALISYYQGL